MSKNPPVNPAKDSEQKLYYKESSQLTGLVPNGDNLEKKNYGRESWKFAGLESLESNSKWVDKTPSPSPSKRKEMEKPTVESADKNSAKANNSEGQQR